MPIPTTTLEGRLTDDPQRNQHNPNLVEFTIAEGTRYQDKQTGQWRDGSTLFARCKVWDATLGNNILNTLKKGMEVVAVADVRQNSWTDQQTGQKRSSVEFNVSNIAPSLRHATAQVIPNPKRNGGYDGANRNNYQQGGGQQFQNPNNYNAGGFGQSAGYQPPSTPSEDPWATPQGGAFDNGQSGAETEF